MIKIKSFAKVAVVAGGLVLGLSQFAGAEAFTLPVSNQLIEGKIELQDGEVINFKVLDGAMVKVKNDDEGLYLGFTPQKLDGERVSFTVFEITEHGEGLEGMSQVGAFETSLGEKASFSGRGYFGIEVTGFAKSTRKMQEIDAFRQQVFFGDGEKNDTPLLGRCCVTCGGTTACGCAITMSCGSCCDGTCCGGGGGGPLHDSDNP